MNSPILVKSIDGDIFNIANTVPRLPKVSPMQGEEKPTDIDPSKVNDTLI